MSIIKQLILAALLVASALGQQEKLGGTGGAGGVGAFQGHFSVVALLSISTNALSDGTVGSAYSQTLTAANGTAPLSWTILLGSLPPGLTIDSSTGTISGTPTALGNYLFTVLVTDSTSPTHLTATKDLSIAITCSPMAIVSSAALPPALVGTAYQFQFNSSGGQGTVTWAASGLSPPYSVSSSGLLTGTPTTANTQTFTVTATDSCPVPQVVQQTATLVTSGTVQIVTPSPLPDGQQGTSYSQQFNAQGGTTPYTWAVSAGSLPNGLTLSSGGALTGTPTVIGAFSFTIQVTDNAAITSTTPFTLTISCPTLAVTTATLPNGAQGVPYNFQLTHSGGVSPFIWSATGLANGLHVSTSGAITGTPTQTGSFTPTVTVTDSCSTVQSASADLTLDVFTGLTITTNATLPPGTVGTAYTANMTAVGGVPPYQWTNPAGPFVAGAEDLIDWMAAKLPDRLNSHLTGGATPKYAKVDAGVLWLIKSANGNPSDIRIYDQDFIYQVYTDNNDASQQAACQADIDPNTGLHYTSCFSDPKAYKQIVTPRQFTPRYFIPGSTVTIMVPPVLTGGGQVNPYVKTTNCGLDNQPIAFLGNVKVVTSNGLTMPVGISTWGGDVGVQPTVEVDYYYSGNVSGVYQNLERFYFVRGWGWVSWDHSTLQGGIYVVDQGSTNNIKTAGGAPTPNFACKIPNLNTLSLAGTLPAGVTSTNSPQMNMASNTGVISGTPVDAGSHAFTVQVEDSVGTITQQDMTMVTSCRALAMASTSPLSLATQGVAYSFQFSATGGALPLTWARINGTGSIPPGMTLSSTGLLSGTPTATGTFSFVVQAVDSCLPVPAQSVQATFQISVQANSGSLAIATTSPLQAATEGQAYNVALAATGGTSPYTWTLAAGSLPSGLSLSSGVISGTPTATSVSAFTVRVTDALAGTTTKALSITVTCPTLAITSPSTIPGAAQNQPYSFQFSSSGGISPVSWTGTSIPTGLALSTSGALTGTPTGSGAASLSITATDSCLATHQTASGSFSLTTTAAPTPVVISTTSPLPAATQGVAYSTQMAATGGTLPYTWSQTGGSLPAGLVISSPAGIISGTPTTIGTTSATLQVSDSLGQTVSGSFSLTVSCVSLAITSGLTLPTGTQNSAYSNQLASSGGTGAKSWSLVGGTLPTGVTLSGAGLVAGTPSTSGTFSPQIRVTDSCSTPQTATSTFTLVINPATVPLQITTGASLPSATINAPYNVTLSAAGGTPPYGSWTVTVGTLPTGMSLGSSTGVISGTPTVAGSSSFTVRVADGVAATATKAFTLVVNSATGADNRYCTSASTITNLPQDGPALPLANCINTAVANSPSPGAVVNVTANSCSSLQSAVSAAVAGVTIKVPPGTYSPCVVTLAASGNASNWITLETSSTSNLPAEGSRISPAWVGITSLPGRPAYSQPGTLGTYLPKIIANQFTITVTGSYWRIIGIEATTTSGVNAAQVVTQTGTSSHIIFDRVLVHGGNNATGQNRDNIQAGIRFTGCAFCAVVDSYIYDTHCVANGTCVDSQAVTAGGSSAVLDGPIKVVNNFLETSGEGIITGGGGVGTATLPGTDLEIRRNHFFKPLFWKANDPTYFGTNFEIKNCLEFKNTKRALIEGNIFDNEWTGQSDQHGVCILFDSRNQSSTASGTASSSGNGTLTWISGGHFTSDVVSSTCATPLHCRVKYNGVTYSAQTFISANQITVSPAPPTLASGSFAQARPGLNPVANTTDITFRYSAVHHSTVGLQISNPNSDNGDPSLGGSNFTIHDIVFDDIDGPRWTSSGNACCVWGDVFQIQNFGSNPLHDISIWHVTGLSTISTSTNPNSGGFLLTGNQSVSGGRIGNLRFYDNLTTAGVITGGSPTCPNTNVARTMMICWTPAAQLCFDSNFLSTSTTPSSGTGSFTRNNPPYPAGADNGYCPYGAPKGNIFPANFAAIQFNNLNGANGGNYQLLNTSPYHNQASDGTDPGVNWPLLQQNIAGVQ